jgi:hypothetical protein
MNTLNLIRKQINKAAALHDAMILVVLKVRKPTVHSAIAVRLTLSD